MEKMSARIRASFCRPGARGRAPRSSGDLLHDIEYKHNYHKMVLPLPILFLSFSLSQSPRADPEHEAIPRMGYPEWDALCALFDHSFPTITITSTTPIYHLDLSITPSSNP